MQQNSGLGSRDQPSKPKRSLTDVVSGQKFLVAKIEMQNDLERQFSRYLAKQSNLTTGGNSSESGSHDVDIRQRIRTQSFVR
jgi:hypothetical protein